MRLSSFALAFLLHSSALAALPHWKVVLVAGDASASVFDNARMELGRLLFLQGVRPSLLFDLSADEKQDGTLPATEGSLRYALSRLGIGPGDACLLHMTSHGSKLGFELETDPPLTPEVLDEILASTCDPRPTVVLVSACYSGIFLSSKMKRPNRILVSAARADRTSFGCDDRGQFNFWDECLLEEWRPSRSWRELYERVAGCIGDLEGAGGEIRSEPQAHFGRDVEGLELPRISWVRPITPDALFDGLWDATDACYPKPEPPEPYGDDVCE